MNKQEFIKCFAHFITESDLNSAFDTHFKELGHMNCYEIEQWLNNVLDDKWIPCSIALPKPYIKVKLKLKNGKEIVGERRDTIETFYSWNTHSWNIKENQIITNSQVIAWQLKEK